jgi:hypothetical protein
MPAVSGRGHDAVYMAKLAPSGMIFIPCKDGISHNEIEDAKPEHITAGCNVLLHAMLERARQWSATPAHVDPDLEQVWNSSGPRIDAVTGRCAGQGHT